jgi:signal transduction histidine kinase
VEPALVDAPASVAHAWLDRVILARGRSASLLAVGAIALGLGVCYGLTMALGGTTVVSTAWYMPMILLAAARFRYPGAAISSAVATVLAGPLSSLGYAEAPSLWLGRGFVFLIVGLVTAALFDQLAAGRERELELAELERDLAVRQAAVIATVSHEFRTPLTVITGVARTLETHGMVTAEGASLLGGLSDAARRLTDLVNTIGAVLDDAGNEAFVRPETVIMRDLLAHVVMTLGVRDAENRVTIRIAPEAEIFVSDRELLGQLLRHLVENAAKFSPRDEPVEIRADRQGQRLRVRILDRGPGIDGALIGSLDPFRQGDHSMTRTKQGLGLGLFAADRLASVLDGSIKFLDRDGGGTEVVVDVFAPVPEDRGAIRRTGTAAD